MEPLPNDVFLCEVFRRLAEAEDRNILLRKEKTELAARHETLLAQLSTRPIQQDTLQDYDAAGQQQGAVQRLQAGNGELLVNISRAGQASTALDAQRAECQRLVAERDHLCRSWQIHCDDTRREFVRELNTANAEISRLQNVLKEREATDNARLSRASALERQVDALKLQLDSKNKELQNTLKEHTDVHEADTSQISALKHSAAELKAQLGANTKQLHDSQILVHRLISEKSELAAQILEYQATRQNALEIARYKSDEIDVLRDSKTTLETIVAKQQDEINSLKTTIEGLQKPSATFESCAVQVDKDLIDVGIQATAPTCDVIVGCTPDHIDWGAHTSTVGAMQQRCASQGKSQETQQSPDIRQMSQTTELLTLTPDTRRSPALSSLSSLSESSTEALPIAISPAIEMPREMKNELKPYPIIEVPAPGRGDTATMFSREELHLNLGGSQDDIVSRFEQPRKALASRHEISGCIFLQRTLNPWLPSQPGGHGYMFVGSWSEDEQLIKPFEFAVFLPVDSAETRWQYFGQYLVQRRIPLLPREWKKLPDAFKRQFCSMTHSRLNGKKHGDWVRADKDKHDSQLDEDLLYVRRRYNAGDLRMPCVQMVCVGYSEDLINDLSSGRRLSTREIRPTWKRKDSPSTSVSGSSKKRLRR